MQTTKTMDASEGYLTIKALRALGVAYTATLSGSLIDPNGGRWLADRPVRIDSLHRGGFVINVDGTIERTRAVRDEAEVRITLNGWMA